MAWMAKLAQLGYQERPDGRVPISLARRPGARLISQEATRRSASVDFAPNSSAGNRSVGAWTRPPSRSLLLTITQPTKRPPSKSTGTETRSEWTVLGLERHARSPAAEWSAARESTFGWPVRPWSWRRRVGWIEKTSDRRVLLAPMRIRPTAIRGLTRLGVYGPPIRSRKLSLMSVYLK